MLIEYPLDLTATLEYARRWAYERNPAYYDFHGIGGDCTNFISQCIYAGGAVMNTTPDTGWYYFSLQDRAPAWTGVEFFYYFMTNNESVGPFGINIPIGEVEVGDIIQLGKDGKYYHNLLVVNMEDGMPYVAAHSKDVYNIPLYAYIYEQSRCLRILGARRYEEQGQA